MSETRVTMMNANDLLPRLKKVKKTASGWTALCPSHDDQRQSLAISESGGKILLKCFAECKVENIVAALGIELKDLFDEPRHITNATSQSPQIVAVYPYTDEHSKLLYEIVRYDPKDFRTRCYDAEGRAVWNLNGTRRVPYRLPEIITAANNGKDIWLCEGEKDADNLLVLGFAASSFKNWKREFTTYLGTAHVCIVQDHDEAGVKQAGDAARLLYGSVLSVKVIDVYADEPLPEKHGKDVSDWIAVKKEEGLTREEIAERLCVIADGAADWQSSETLPNKPAQNEDFNSLFKIQSASEWINNAKLRPVPKMLFGELWFEGELCILFADTGKGKTILAVQIADSITRGLSIEHFALEAEKQKALYFDFELSDKQFEARYSMKQGDYFTNHYEFHENFQRGEINQSSFVPSGFKDFESYLNFSLEYEIASTGARILIVDNITYLKNATETAKDALPLMKELIRLKKKFDLSILALAHTPKRDLTRPLTVNDLQGSKMLSNFADSIFAIGESAKDKSLRYIKQIKARNTEEVYHSENVAVCQIIKPYNFLMFEFLDFGNEREHLKALSEKDKADLIQQAKNLSAAGESQRKISRELGISLGTVNNYLKK